VVGPWQADRVPYLALDTSAGIAVALVDDDGSVAARATDTAPRRHAEQLAVHIDAVLARAGLVPRDLTSIVVGTGPAPFTGLRAGLVTARTLGRVLDIAVLGVCSLGATALAALELHDGAAQVVVVTDARRHEVYWARYARDEALLVRLVDGPGVGAPTNVPRAGALLAGRGAHLLDTTVETRFVALDPDPVALCRLAVAMRAHQVPTPVEPLYLRRPDAVVPAAVRQ